MIFELGATTVELDDPAQWSGAVKTKLIQSKDMSAGGIPHVENYDVKSTIVKHVFTKTSDSDYFKILNFFVNVAEGMLNSFDLTDDFGDTTTVNFLEPMIEFTPTSYGLWSGSFQTEEVE